MEEILLEFIAMLKLMEYQSKPAKLMLPKILISSAALIFKNVRTVLLLPVPNQEIKEIVGLSLNTMSGK